MPGRRGLPGRAVAGRRLHPSGVQEFAFPCLKDVGPTTVGADGTLLAAEGVAVMTYSGAGGGTAPVQAVATAGGCEASELADFQAGNVALIRRGSCSFAVRAAHVEAAGASTVLISSTGLPNSEGAVAGTLGSPRGDHLADGWSHPPDS